MNTLAKATRWAATGLLVCVGAGACTPPSAPPTATPTAAEQALTVKLDRFFAGMTESHAFSGSVLVVRGDTTLLRDAYGYADRERQTPNTVDTRFRIGTLTTLFTAQAIMMLQEQGRLSVNDRLCAHLADCPKDWEAITLHQLLTQTSGIADYTASEDYALFKGQPQTHSELLARVKDQDLQFEPGAKWAFSVSNAVLLGLVIEAVSGRSYQTFVTDEILKPAGMTQAGFEQAPAGLAIGYAGRSNDLAEPVDLSVAYAWGDLTATVDDLRSWTRSLESGTPLSADAQTVMMQAHVDIPEAAIWDQGYGWIVGQDFEHDLGFMWGYADGFAAALKYFPEERLTIIVLSNQQSVNAIGIASQIVSMIYD